MQHTPKNFVPTPLAYHQEIELTIDTLTNLGHGLGRYNAGEGYENWVVMVPFTLPGETARVRIYKNAKAHSNADLISITKPSPQRVEAKCPLFTQCGGCQYQHFAYEGQLKWKQQQIAELFQRIGQFSTDVIEAKLQPTIPSPKQYHYRSKLTPHYAGLKGRQPIPGGAPFPIGFLATGTRNKILDVPQCPIATEGVNAALPAVRTEAHTNLAQKKKGGTLLIREGLEGTTTDHKATLSENVNGQVLQFQAGEFFQNNRFILPELVNYVLNAAETGTPAVQYLVDAYCGVGLFALAAAERFTSCAGVEVSERAVHYARMNAAALNKDNVSFHLNKAEGIFESITYPGSETAAVLDPPRAGCSPAFLEQLISFNPARIVYVACGPDTQARDCHILAQAGYHIQTIQPFDLFPQTRHIENVVVLTKA